MRKVTLRSANFNDAILITLAALDRPAAACEVAEALSQEKHPLFRPREGQGAFNAYLEQRPRVMSRLLWLEKQKMVRRARHGWTLTARGIKTPCLAIASTT